MVTMQEPLPKQSALSWFVDALGPFYLVVLPLLGLLLLFGGLMVVIASRRPAVIAACLAFVALPLLLGLLGMLQGMVESFTVISTTLTQPRPGDIAAGFSSAMVVPLVSLIVTLPGYLILATGLVFRTATTARGQPAAG